MTKFDKIIGYETIKTELEQICDMIHNKEIYIALGQKCLTDCSYMEIRGLVKP